MNHSASETFHLEWSRFHPLVASRCLIPVGLLLLAGFLWGHPTEGFLAASGAFSAGFGSFQRFGPSRLAPMATASVGIAFSSLVGTLVGRSMIAAVVASGLWGVLYAVISGLGAGPSWAALQSVLWLVIFEVSPGGAGDGLVHGGLLLAGGLAQTIATALAAAVSRLFHRPRSAAAPAAPEERLRFPFAAQAGLTLMATTALGRGLELPNGYWLPLTAAIIMRPRYEETYQRGVARILGTMLGAGIATLIAAAFHPDPPALALIVLAFAWMSTAMIHVNYAAFSVFVTGYVVFFLASRGLPALTIIPRRVLYTAAGGTAALVIHRLLRAIEGKEEGHAKRSS